jgi:hypothetical protein
MNKTLDKVVKRTASGLGLAGLLAMTSGCLGTAIISGYGAQFNQPGAYAFGNALNQTEAAKEGRTQVTVNNNTNGQANNSNNDYRSPNNSEDARVPEGLRNGTLKGRNGDVYTGQILGEKAHGEGTYFYAKGGKYTGEFRFGKKEGHGTWYMPDGDKAEGVYHNDLMDGPHTFMLTGTENGKIEVGYYIEGKYVGKIKEEYEAKLKEKTSEKDK